MNFLMRIGNSTYLREKPEGEERKILREKRRPERERKQKATSYNTANLG
jgi:hypothetical protein